MEELCAQRKDHRTFTERLQSLYFQWRHHKHDWWGSADFFAIATPPPTPSKDLRYLKSSTLHSWLLGYEFPDTVTVFGDKHIHFLCNQYKSRLLESITKCAKEAVDVDIIIHTVLKAEDETSKMDDMVSSMRMSKSDSAPIVGCIVDESPKGRLPEKWADKLSYSGFEICDVTCGLINVFAINDPDEDGMIAFEKVECRKRYRGELVRKKNQENARRFADRYNAGASGADDAYLSVDDLPRPPSQAMIQVDSGKEAVILPIYGIMVPFHLSTVRRVSSLLGTNDECCIRIVFKAPHEMGAISVNAVSFRSNDPSRICDVVQLIKKLTHRRNAIARKCESQAGRPSTVVVSQTDLVLDGNKSVPISLSGLCIHPPLGGGSVSMVAGALEAHVNGFRYSTSRQDEKVEVMYENIDHAFYQPEETFAEMNALLHLRLHNHVVVGNKKTKDVQFYMDETLEEDEKRRINMELQDFVNKVNGLWLQQPEFEQALEEHGFFGQVVVPNISKASYAYVVPTKSCLVVLKSTPFLVIKLSEIELVNLERIRAGERDFDMVIVFKDFKRDVVRIDSISSWSFQGIKAWLHTCTDIEYFERRVNLHWGAILKTFIDDPQVFIDLGGWGFLAQGPKRQRIQI